MERKNAWKKYSDEDKNNVFTFADEYKTFISECKTERECVKKAVELAKKAGYRDLQEIIAANETLKAGDKTPHALYNRDKVFTQSRQSVYTITTWIVKNL